MISIIVLLITPILPFSAPFKARLGTCQLVFLGSNAVHSHLKANPQKVFDNAKQYMESERPNRPIRITGFLPIWSESLLQCRTVHAWAAKNKDCWKPDHDFSAP